MNRSLFAGPQQRRRLVLAGERSRGRHSVHSLHSFIVFIQLANSFYIIGSLFPYFVFIQLAGLFLHNWVSFSSFSPVRGCGGGH